MNMSSSFFLFFFLSIFFFLQSVNSVDYLGDQGSQLINQFLLNPESIVSNTEKLLAIAQYISKTLDNNQTIETIKEQIALNNQTGNIARGSRIGCVKINANYFVKHKSFIRNKSIITNLLANGVIQVLKRTEATQFFAKTLKTFTLQSGVIYNKNYGIFIHGDVILGKIKTKKAIKASSFIVNGVKQWNLLSHDDFDENTHHWNFNKTNKCSSSNENYFLGGHCNLAVDEVKKRFENLPEHKQVRVQATFHMFDNWQGEHGYMKIDDAIVWKQNGYKNKLETMNLCGNEDFDDPNMNLKIDIVLQHHISNFNLIFGTNLNKNPCEASFAIDDVILYVK